MRFWPATSEPLPLHTLLLNLLRVFSLGLTVQPHAGPVLGAFAALLLAGIAASATAVRLDAEGKVNAADYTVALTLILYLLVPIGVMYILSLRRPMVDPKFLLFCTPPFHLFLAQGALFLAHLGEAKSRRHLGEEEASGQAGQSTVLGTPSRPDGVGTPSRPDGVGTPSRRLPYSASIPLRRGPDGVRTGTLGHLPWLSSGLLLVLVAVVAIPSLRSLQAYYFDPRYARDDYRGIAQYIAAVERENDAVLINAPSQIETFAYYYAGRLPVYPLPRQRPLDEVETEADLQQMIQGRGRIFAVLWATDESDPKRFVEGWLDQHAYKALDSWYGRIRLVAYAVPAQAGSEEMEYAKPVNLGNQVRLLGYSLPTTEVMPGDILQLTLFWQALAPIGERYKVFTHVLDGNGHLVGQRDAEPGGGAKITTIWKEGEKIVDNYGLPILPATPPGDYAIEIGMYALSNGQRLPVMEGGQSVGDRIVLQQVQVLPALAPPPISVLGLKRQLDIRVAGLALLGYDLARLGLEHEPDPAFRPGDILHLTLFWQAHDPPAGTPPLGLRPPGRTASRPDGDGDPTLLLQLEDDKKMVRAEREAQLTEGQYPVRLWRSGEIVRDQHNWPLPTELAPGRYRIYLSIQGLPAGEPVAPRILLANLLLG